ncbi:MAG: AMP-binding protein [Myxococcaceae bacterium]
MESPVLSVSRALAGKKILLTGSTGFLGKVTLSMLLHRYGEALGRVWVLVRRGSATSAEARFVEKVVRSEPFQPLRDHRGDAEAEAFVRARCGVLDGDITDPLFGLSDEELQALTGQVDVVVNCAGLVSFNPPLEVGLKINTYGVRNAVELSQRLGASLIHVSTAFVVGNRSGLVFEDEELVGYFPRKGELDGRDFSLKDELDDAARLGKRLREQAEDHSLTSDFRAKALERLEEEGRDPRDDKTLRLAVGRERKLWLTQKLTEAGMDRARSWGWPNTYTYTKSLGEQVIAGTPNLNYAIVRPTIVESALRYPFPGWNEGFTTSAPLAFAGLKGHRMVPAAERAILDIIPVDLVAGSLIAITARTLTHPERRVYQQASGDSNPFYAPRSVELVGLYRRKHFRARETGSALLNDVKSRLEPRPVSKRSFLTRSAPLFLSGARLLRQGIEDHGPRWGAPRVSAMLERAKEQLERVEEQASSLSMLIELFLPFLWEIRYVFRCDNTRSLYAAMDPEDVAKIPWDPHAIDWRRYFLEVHLPGLEKWVFPGLEEEREKRKAIHAHRDLLELFDAAVHAYRHRVAFRRVEDDREERFTYGEVHRWAARVASFLLRSGVKHRDRVLLISENRPEWPIAYFGILRAGATVVPVDPASSEAEVVNIVRRSEAKVVLLSEDAAQDLGGLFRTLSEQSLEVSVATLAQAMEGDVGQPGRIGAVRKSAAPDDVASLIFTSGTTGTPKGVMLTHRNFASLVPKLAASFDFGVGDGLLSVLPLHHTFEFSAGLLTPFSRGAEVTYLDELTTDRLGEVFESGHVTAMIGVPALWTLFHRKVTQELAAKPAIVEQGMRALMSAHGSLRNRKNINIGKLLFWPVHRKFGGRIKFMISGGSALPDEVHKAFHDLGFDLAEGYGLTEAAPVLSVQAPGNKRVAGSVGKALPGIELRIDEPDNEGIGEVCARGPNVMAGYFADREATDATLKDGWLRTGDLGRLDAEGQLFLVGRKKDVIIDANGKNVYPDELEELYGEHRSVKELSVVGLSDEAGGETVACLCVPDYGERRREDVRAEIEEHFRHVSSTLPFHRRIKVLRFWDGELPRTSTRKVKRKLVVDELRKLEKLAASGEKARPAAHGGSTDWLQRLVAEVIGKPASEVRPESRLAADLGFDSLMLTELSVSLESAGITLPEAGDLSGVETVKDLARLLGSAVRRLAEPAEGVQPARAEAEPDSREIPVPAPVATLGRSMLALWQKAMFGGVFDVKVSGHAYVPQSGNFLVIANHSSHLDMGLVKYALGEQGERMASLAARDYFFDTPLKRAWFENFTNLIPMDRHGSLRESLRLAGEAIQHGHHLLIFPEGTRSPDGQMREFYPTLGYLALTYGVDILPVYIQGAYEALPKGSMFPKQKEIAVRIGPALGISELRRRAQGLARSESYRLVTRIAEEAVKRLREGGVFWLEPDVELAPAPVRPRRSSGGGPR